MGVTFQFGNTFRSFISDLLLIGDCWGFISGYFIFISDYWNSISGFSIFISNYWNSIIDFTTLSAILLVV